MYISNDDNCCAKEIYLFLYNLSTMSSFWIFLADLISEFFLPKTHFKSSPVGLVCRL